MSSVTECVLGAKSKMMGESYENFKGEKNLLSRKTVIGKSSKQELI